MTIVPCFRRIRIAVLPLVLAAVLPLHAAAQCTVDNQAAVSISPSQITFSTPTITEFTSGAIVYQSTISIVVNGQGNRPWSLCLDALTIDLGTAGGTTKPLSDLQWQAPGGTWTPVTFAPQVIAADRGDTTILMSVRMLLDWVSTPPGTFGTTVRVTVART